MNFSRENLHSETMATMLAWDIQKPPSGLAKVSLNKDESWVSLLIAWFMHKMNKMAKELASIIKMLQSKEQD